MNFKKTIAILSILVLLLVLSGNGFAQSNAISNVITKALYSGFTTDRCSAQCGEFFENVKASKNDFAISEKANYNSLCWNNFDIGLANSKLTNSFWLPVWNKGYLETENDLCNKSEETEKKYCYCKFEGIVKKCNAEVKTFTQKRDGDKINFEVELVPKNGKKELTNCDGKIWAIYDPNECSAILKNSAYGVGLSPVAYGSAGMRTGKIQNGDTDKQPWLSAVIPLPEESYYCFAIDADSSGKIDGEDPYKVAVDLDKETATTLKTAIPSAEEKGLKFTELLVKKDDKSYRTLYALDADNGKKNTLTDKKQFALKLTGIDGKKALYFSTKSCSDLKQTIKQNVAPPGAGEYVDRLLSNQSPEQFYDFFSETPTNAFLQPVGGKYVVGNDLSLVKAERKQSSENPINNEIVLTIFTINPTNDLSAKEAYFINTEKNDAINGFLLVDKIDGKAIEQFSGTIEIHACQFIRENDDKEAKVSLEVLETATEAKETIKATCPEIEKITDLQQLMACIDKENFWKEFLNSEISPTENADTALTEDEALAIARQAEGETK